ncbi:FAD-dependent oxidoreductase [Roseobacter sp. HKCCD9010]|uniref:FAD-dependent oxidoreductase n=1 Tax=unclassified Roseobacter TaxID=196798 RepID=UPI001492CAD0|nr:MULTISPECIES: FAD-dependent oxidoreductase [unclassified Roseobacter]MBF9048870.1 FAD-dependent oxidoreductase [Rhodobacterales bacterium HKCCD4356]NNV10869.1 FAD-dependent oxidoreductase [Roseobacter sp. HKCCD7357]NNV15054.1 FAD-dependent oxidoreductase [Roseobacter sp. HKCCD8768]NNV24513.1 FAD-dependent oxidoreductase [Roseobacter sp. HKCCD8192]NNV28770.1 FAD-dependent oxidoreductase [Roseobacter sp. HKCCD9061]
MNMEPRYRLAFELYPYEKHADQDASVPVRHPIIIVGAGPIGVATALDLGQRGQHVLVLDDHEGIGEGSRAICFSQRCLEIADRLGCGEAMVEKGVVWNLGKVFHGADRVFEFNLQPEDGHKNPAFINLQQPYFERFLVDHVRAEQAKGTPIEIRGRNRVTALEEKDDHILLSIETPDGPYQIETDWLIACDGARSPLRDMMGFGFEGRVFEDNFLIADVKMTADFPTERWFWFEPPFKDSGQSALLHKQPDDVWRIDFQLGWDIDREKELDEANIRARVDAMLGPDAEYELEWTSIYTFQCRRMEAFRHGRVMFAGDAAHQVSPFGARGANSGMQDAENLAWKLDLVIRGLAPDSLLDTYSEERVHGADENILNSTRATDFITPKTEISALFRNAVLHLAHDHPFARPLVNSGRLSVPCTYDGLSLTGDDNLPGGPGRTRPGAPCVDAPLGSQFLLNMLGQGFSLLTIDAEAPDDLTEAQIPITRLALGAEDDATGALAERYLGDTQSAVYLIRPDHHVVARWAAFDEGATRTALRRAIGQE